MLSIFLNEGKCVEIAVEDGVIRSVTEGVMLEDALWISPGWTAF
jgi:hypothetical protein